MKAFERFIEFLSQDDVSQAQLAQSGGVSQAYVSRLKRRLHRPKPSFVKAVADAMDERECFSDELDRVRFELEFRNMPAGAAA